MLIIPLLVLVGAVVYFMTPEERSRLLGGAIAVARRLGDVAVRAREHHREARAAAEPQPLPIVTLAIAATTIAAFAAVVLEPGSIAAESLIRWGGNFGPRTTNGEWWRLASASFLHAGVLDLLVNLAAFVQVCAVLERVVGRSTAAAVYLSSGIFASVVSVWLRPVEVTVGASGAIFGLYGLLLTSWMWGLVGGSRAIRLPVIRKLAPMAVVFMLYHIFTEQVHGRAETASLVTGFVCGLVLVKGIHVSKPPARRVSFALAASAIVAVVTAVPLRGLTDIRPVIANLVAVEQRTAADYDREVAQFRTARLNARALGDVIERRIVPALRTAGAPLAELRGVPEEHEPLRVAAKDYLRLREESWRLRLAGLRRGSLPTLREADKLERGALEYLKVLDPSSQR